MKIRLFHEGRFTGLGTLICGLIAFALICYTFFFAESRWLGIASMVLAMVLLSIASLSNSAASVGLPPPFTNDPLGWRVTKKSHIQESDQSAEKTAKDDSHVDSL